MKLIWASLCFIFVYVSFLSDAQSSLIAGSELVRVRLLSTTHKVQISGLGLKFHNLDRPYRQVAIPDSGQAEVRLMERAGKKVWSLRINNKDPETLFSEKFLYIQGENLRVGSQSLPQKVLLHASKEKVDVVGVMPLEDYVVGVLASEMPLSWPMESLKAQAVAARSYALAVMRERKDKPYHLESSILDQVFRHVLAEDENDPLIKKALQAVKETQGQKLYASNDKVLKAFFHSDCGGKTTTAKSVWNHGVNTGVATDASCPTNPRANWKLSLSKEELHKRLQLPPIAKIDFIRNKEDKRVLKVKVAMNDSSVAEIPANDFRQKIGFTELRSTMFTMNKVGENFVFEGRGFGHGVGLCQWGSRALSRSGYDYKRILTHYYPLARLK
ncbi:SpoIID/LytB domain-containing protein [Bdellovibrio bacteriovorus]|uniref:SpoIID/LytB domain-containing protein n=1 Tax=Bdellovibrio bacteriovorus TaxID=959 RepID=UPI000B1EBA1D|nr:SpoIID/LytB domain-containing protein [Bdellovibrio bacteriovorus]